MKYRKKPVIVEAVQWEGPWCRLPQVGTEELGKATKAESSEVRFFVATIHGRRAYLSKNDWLIQEPDGEHWYPCKPDIFEATYEPA